MTINKKYTIKNSNTRIFIARTRLTTPHHELLSQWIFTIPAAGPATIHDFLTISKPHWLIAMQEHHQRCMTSPAD